MIRMFIDDVRYPPDDGNKWIIIRSYDQFVDYAMENKILPNFISFDHDLGMESENGHELVKDMLNSVIDGFNELPEDFAYEVHSANPVGAKNIHGVLECYFKYKDKI